MTAPAPAPRDSGNGEPRGSERGHRAPAEQAHPRSPAGQPRPPRSTYRLQLNRSFTLRDAAGQVEYLRRLGADWIYCSPLLASEPGSGHGYDTVDHVSTDADRGGRAGLAMLADTAHGAGMGVLVDIVPNHVGVATPAVSVWWWDVLQCGQQSEHAAAFDIDWVAGAGRVLIPVLGDATGTDPDGELDAIRVDGGLLRYYEHAFPVAAGTAGGTPREVHDRQHYRLVNFRRADADLNYRRFFAVSTLAAIRPEIPEVFAASHVEIGRWLDSGWVDGLRVDHPDGLADPAGYLHDLASLSGGRWTVVEKILETGEELPAGWACDGTTGYETLALVDRLLVDPTGRDALRSLDTDLRGSRCGWDELTHRTKRAVADGILGSEIRRLARLVPPVSTGPDVGPDVGSDAGGVRAAGSPEPAAVGAEPAAVGAEPAAVGADPAVVDAIAELTACFPVYRSYLPEGADHLRVALSRARRLRPDLAGALDRIQPLAAAAGSEFSVRLQQTTGAVMAKGVEDCAFYRYPLLASLTEVGGDPSQFAVTPDEFHRSQSRRLSGWPDGMTTLSTHDTKRGEDVRARIDVLSEVAADWATAVTGWLEGSGFPDRVLGHLLLQSAVGAWPIERDRLHGYAEKAAREAGSSTRWIDPDAAFEQRLHALVDACYDDRVIATGLSEFAEGIRHPGWVNSLSAKLIQLTLPGVPDVYRGTELWENSLVDPDNRRPFDPLAVSGAADLLERIDTGWLPPVDGTGAVKLLVTCRTLRARRDRPELFTGYRPLRASGPAADHLVGFDRGGAITLATRLPVGLAAAGGWGETVLAIPRGALADAITGRTVEAGPAREGSVTVGGARSEGSVTVGGALSEGSVTVGGALSEGSVTVRVADLLDRYPVALLLPAP